MGIIKTILTGAAVLFLCTSVQAAGGDRIVAVVNDEVITLFELTGAFAPFQERAGGDLQGGGAGEGPDRIQAGPSEPDDRRCPHGAAVPEGRDRHPR